MMPGPGGSEPGDRLERAGLLEQVRCPGNVLEALLGAEPFVGLPIQLEANVKPK
jgi:hypothetical protein